MVAALESITGTWRRSSYSTGNDCVEVARSHRVVAVRDSKDPVGANLTFGRSGWVSFARALEGENPRSRTGT